VFIFASPGVHVGQPAIHHWEHEANAITSRFVDA
jgi:hypothetical protein